MTHEDKARQVGELMLKQKQLADDLSHHREQAESYKARINTILDGWGYLAIDSVDGFGVAREGTFTAINLPTTDELRDVIRTIKGLEAEMLAVNERLRALGF